MNTLTDHELEDMKQHCYAEGRKDESEAKAEALKAALEALKAIHAETAGPGRPYSVDSYLPPRFVDQAAAAIKSIEGVLA